MVNQLLWLVPGLALPLLARAAPGCSDITLKVTASSNANDIAPLSIDPRNPLDSVLNTVVGDIGRLWPLVETGGTYDISATFCEPEQYNDANAVQLLSHGATYNKLYWSGLGLPKDQAEPYDWTRYATDRGYAVLAIDRLGAGNSSHPDPLLETQASLEAEVIHQVAQQLRDGKACGKKFSKIGYVGHSMGSLIGVRATQIHPEDFDAVILTGWSVNFVEDFPKVLAGALLPAGITFPQRFGNLHPLYFVLNIGALVRQFFYGPEKTFDPAVEQYDWANRDAVGVGELISILAGTTETNYAGSVLVIDGEYDAAFCGLGGQCTSSPNSPPKNAVSIFPKVKKFETEIIPDAGHCLNVHFSAHDTFKRAHDFFDQNL